VRERGLPFLGLCLGHQLLAEALGGEVGPSATPEVGIMEVELTEAGRADPLFAGIALRIRALQWHGAEVSAAPAGASVLARGIVGDRNGVLKVASPMYKQSFALESGRCLDDDEVAVPTFRSRISGGVVQVAAEPS